MSSDLREPIYNNMNLKETDELLNIWQTNDRVEWTETAFQVVKEILLDRIIEIPPQNPAITKHPEPPLPSILQKEQEGNYDFPLHKTLRISIVSMLALFLFFIITLIINPDLGNSDTLAYLFSLGYGICISIAGCVYTYYAWTLNASQFFEWQLAQQIIHFTGQSRVMRLFSSYQLWANRLASPLMILVGVSAIGFALLSVVTGWLK